MMKSYILDIALRSKTSDLYEPSVNPSYDPLDYALPEPIVNAKWIMEYVLAQPVFIDDHNRFTGPFRYLYDELPAPGDAYLRPNHPALSFAEKNFYNRYLDNLVVFEWQHSAPNYSFIVENGIEGSLVKIQTAKEKFADDSNKLAYLTGVQIVCEQVIAWAEKCAAAHENRAATERDPKRKKELLELAGICRNVPRKPAKSFHEGLQTILFCFKFLPDSVGTIDRTLWKLYQHDIENGIITREEAKELIAEVFVHFGHHIDPKHPQYDRSAECHFAVGGYTADGEDGFTDLSRLMVEALMELPTRKPAISMRWTKKTRYEDFKFVLDCERHDPLKRFTVVNDEPRLAALTEYCGFSYEDAVKYTTCGCNEPAIPGTVWFGGQTVNIARSLVNTLYNRTDEIIKCKTFEEFYAIYCEELRKDIAEIMHYSDIFNDIRAKDVNVLSAFLYDGCIESATGPFQYGCNKKIGGFNAMGITCVIDSLTVIKQFVFEEKRTDLAHLVEVMRNDWKSDEDLQTEIVKTAKFFGNDEPISNEMARRFTTELYRATEPYRVRNGARVIIGTLAGYNPHNMVYGRMTPATPDGRHKGEGFMVGVGQNKGKDRKGLIPLLKSIACMDPRHILTGPNVGNIFVDQKYQTDDLYFEKTVRAFEEYFKLGGIHIQLNYCNAEDLVKAKAKPEEYSNLDVRVSGFSAKFVQLHELQQDEIIMRTVEQV